MTRKPVTVEDLEALADQLRGPLGTALRATGVILERRMRERGTSWGDLNDREAADLFMSAFMEAAPEAYPHADRAVLEEMIGIISRDIALQLAANVEGSGSVN